WIRSWGRSISGGTVRHRQGPYNARTGPTSPLPRLMLVDRRLHGGLRLGAGGRVLRRRVVIAELAQRVGVALEVRVDVARHQLVALARLRPVGPVVRQQQHAADAAVRALP